MRDGRGRYWAAWWTFENGNMYYFKTTLPRPRNLPDPHDWLIPADWLAL